MVEFSVHLHVPTSSTRPSCVQFRGAIHHDILELHVVGRQSAFRMIYNKFTNQYVHSSRTDVSFSFKDFFPPSITDKKK
jgi:hypothetical protein